jgi:two-component system chemotaxis sensor kinase CheA
MARDPYRYFRIEARQLTGDLGQGLLALERGGGDAELVPRLLRLAHTLKGAARVVRLPEIADQTHAIEDLLTPLRDTSTTAGGAIVGQLLALLDRIVAAVAALPAPDAPVAQPGNAAPVPEAAAPWVHSADVAAIDRLLENVTEAYAQLNLLGSLTARADTATAMSVQLADDFDIAVRAGASGNEARGLLGQLEQLSGLTGDVERGITEVHRRVDREIRQLRDGIEQLRLLPASTLFPGCERATRDSAQALGRQVTFTGSGGDIRLDGQVARIVQDAWQQLVRNAVAHGIEAPAARTAIGKPAAGQVTVAVLRRGNRIVFRCEDDGRGIDLPALRDAAIRRGRPAVDLDRLDSAGIARLLLQGGVSTSATVSEVAGRGIGMDIVRDAVTRLGAEFDVATTPGKGTRFDLVVPQSLASIDAIMVEAAAIRATVPLHAVRQAQRLAPGDIRHTPDGDAVMHDGDAIPLVPLARLLGPAAGQGPAETLSALVVAGAAGRVALGVTHMHGTTSVVFRPLPELAPSTSVVAGASLDADGRPLLMLDPDGVVAAARQAATMPVAQTPRPARPLLVIDDSLTTRMLEQSILESAGYRVELAVSGEEGLERARAGDHALILVDVEMPGMDGFTFIEHIRRDPRLHDTPAILVTSRNAPEDKRRGVDVGAQDYVVKSEFDQAVLLARIRQLVGGDG